MTEPSFHADFDTGGFDVIVDGVRIGLVYDTTDGWVFLAVVDRAAGTYRFAGRGTTRADALVSALSDTAL